MKEYNEETLLWLADLKVQKLLKEREIEHEIAIIKTDCGLSNNYVEEFFLDDLRRAYYDLQEIEEALKAYPKEKAITEDILSLIQTEYNDQTNKVG